MARKTHQRLCIDVPNMCTYHPTIPCKYKQTEWRNGSFEQCYFLLHTYIFMYMQHFLANPTLVFPGTTSIWHSRIQIGISHETSADTFRNIFASTWYVWIERWNLNIWKDTNRGFLNDIDSNRVCIGSGHFGPIKEKLGIELRNTDC